MSDIIVVGNLEKLQNEKCEFKGTYVWKEKVERADFDRETRVKWRINSTLLLYAGIKLQNIKLILLRIQM